MTKGLARSACRDQNDDSAHQHAARHSCSTPLLSTHLRARGWTGSRLAGLRSARSCTVLSPAYRSWDLSHGYRELHPLRSALLGASCLPASPRHRADEEELAATSRSARRNSLHTTATTPRPSCSAVFPNRRSNSSRISRPESEAACCGAAASRGVGGSLPPKGERCVARGERADQGAPTRR